MNTLRKTTYQSTSNSIQVLLNLSSLNGLLLVLLLLIAFDASTNIVALYAMFIKGFERLTVYSAEFCIAFCSMLSLVLGIGILVMNTQVPKYSEMGKVSIHKAAYRLSVVSGILSAFGYLELVLGHYPSFEAIPISPIVIFHVGMGIAIAWAVPMSYGAISVHIRKQFGSSITNFTEEILKVAEDVSVQSFKNEAGEDLNKQKTVEEKTKEAQKALQQALKQLKMPSN